MKNPLQDALTALNESNSEQELKDYFLPKIGDYFQATRCGLFLFDTPGEELRKQTLLTKTPFKEALRTSLSVEKNPVVRYLLERHAPVHEALVTSPRVWKLICPRADHWPLWQGQLSVAVSSWGSLAVLANVR